jgi:hypothetical protein
MKKSIVLVIFIFVLACHSEEAINLTGRFDIILNTKPSAVLILKQEGTKLTGFFQWINTYDGRRVGGQVFEITGTSVPDLQKKRCSVKIVVNSNVQLYSIEGNASDSDSFIGTFKQLTSAPAISRGYGEETQSIIAIRESFIIH